MPPGQRDGPACGVTVSLPDYHAFRGSYGGYAFPLYDRRPGHGPYNLLAELIAALGEAYGAPVTAAQVFDAMLALLSAANYTSRFAEDLEDTFPHVPFPSDPAVFAGAAALDAAIARWKTFARKPGARCSRGLGLVGGRAEGRPGSGGSVQGNCDSAPMVRASSRPCRGRRGISP